jgi:hypothetical protein
MEEISKDRTKKKIKKPSSSYSGGKNTGGQVAVANKFCR